MIWREVQQAYRARLRRKLLWVVFALATSAFLVYPTVMWAVAMPRESMGTLGKDILLEVSSAGSLYFLFIWIAPMAWQWDGRPGVSPRPSGRILLGFLAAEGLILLHVMVQEGLNRCMGRPGFEWPTYLMSLCFQGPALFLVGSLHATSERLEQEREELRSRTDTVMADQLKGQIHPHVLFNTLNGLAELMQTDPEAANVLVESMSGFLQRVVDVAQQPAWPLKEEQLLAEDYLRMEATRLGSRLRLVCHWDESIEPMKVLPLLIQPLVENALKHGVSRTTSGGEVVVRSQAQGEGFVLEVKNTPVHMDAPHPPRRGTGLSNLRRRLELAYGEHASFELLQEAEWMTARVHVQQASALKA